MRPVYYDRRNRFFILVGSILALGIALAIAVFVPPHFQLDQPVQGNLTPYSGVEYHGPIPTPTIDPPHAGPLPTDPPTSPTQTPSIDQGVTSNGSTLTFTIHFTTTAPRSIKWTIYSQSGSVVYQAQWSAQSRDVVATFNTGLAHGSYSLTTSVNGKIVRTHALFEVK